MPPVLNDPTVAYCYFECVARIELHIDSITVCVARAARVIELCSDVIELCSDDEDDLVEPRHDRVSNYIGVV